MTPAVFLDRDGTLVHDPGFLRDVADVELLDSVPDALAALSHAGYLLIVVTNQSGIARGITTEAQLAAVNREIARQLAEHGVAIADWYHCPHLPDARCACRKPGTALHREAAERHGIDPARSWCVGDRLSDLEPATALGGRGILVRTGKGRDHEAAAREAGFPVANDLLAAAALIAVGGRRTERPNDR